MNWIILLRTGWLMPARLVLMVALVSMIQWHSRPQITAPPPGASPQASTPSAAAKPLVSSASITDQVVAASTVGATARTQPPPSTSTTPSKPVFAWYMTPFYTYSRYGATDAEAVAGYKRDIQDAQAAGVDGFALYIGPQQYLLDNTRNMFEAAKQLHDANPTSPPFLLYLGPEASPDDSVRTIFPGTSTNWIVHFLSAFAAHPNYYHYQNRPVVMPFLGLKVDRSAGVDQQSDWASDVFTPLRASGITPFFVPSLFNTNDVTTTDSAGNHTTTFTTWARQYVDGLNYWTGNTPTNDINGSNSMSSIATLNSKLYAGGVAIGHYWANRTSPYVYFEHYGGEGPASSWKNAIQNQTTAWMVETTWNDYTETYANPVDPSLPTILAGYGGEALLKPHTGYTEQSKYYAQWYKTGKAPSVTKDGLIYFYRTHPKNLVATADTSQTIFNPSAPSDTVPDDVFVTTMLKSPATLTVASGGTVTNVSVAAGVQFSRVAFQPGAQVFSLKRKGTTLVSVTGEPIATSISRYNFIPTTGFAYTR